MVDVIKIWKNGGCTISKFGEYMKFCQLIKNKFIINYANQYLLL